jgi:hypothetical protein
MIQWRPGCNKQGANKMKKSTIKNVHINDDKTGYVVRYPNGKTKTYKTLRGAETRAILVQCSEYIPGVVVSNTYFWRPDGSASGRRNNEARRQAEIDDFCSLVNRVPTVEASGSYEESCKNVYKSMSYEVNGSSTNLTGLIGECARWGLNLIK